MLLYLYKVSIHNQFDKSQIFIPYSISFDIYYLMEQVQFKNRAPTNQQICKIDTLIKNKLIDALILEVQYLKNMGVVFDQSYHIVLQRMHIIHMKLNACIKHFAEGIEGWNSYTLKNNSWLGLRIKGSNVEMRLQQQFDANIENLCLMIYFVHLYSQWVIFCTESINAKQIDELEKVVFIRLKIPLLSQRCAFLHGMGVDRIEHNNTIVIYAEGVTENQQFFKQMKLEKKQILKHENFQPFDLKQAVAQISFKDGKFYLKCYSQIDIRMSFIPQWAIRQIMKLIGKFAVQKLINYANNFKGSIWEAQIKQKKHQEFYKWLVQKTSSWIKGKKVH